MKEQKYTMRTRQVVINSLDRPWYGYIDNEGNVYESSFTDRHKYTVTFNGNSDSFVQQPVYENSKYEPYTDTVKMELGQPRALNTGGFIFNGKSYSAYDPSQPKGTIQDYQTVKIPGQTSSFSVQETFQNIVKAQFKRIVLPRHYKIISNDSHRRYRGVDSVGQYGRKMVFVGPKNLPYLLIHVKEFDSKIVTTYKSNQSIFCKVYYDKETSEFRWLDWNKHYMRGVCFYTNKDAEASLYTHTPIARLNKLTIEIQNDRGKVFDDTKDNLQIKSIKFDPTTNGNTSMMVIELTTYVDKYYFRQNDQIRCKLYNLKPQYRKLQEFLEKGQSYWIHLQLAVI